MKFKNFNQKRKHVMVEHFGYIGCTRCTRSFATEELLVAHDNKHDRKYFCDPCKIEFNVQRGLQVHLEQIHNKGKKEVVIHKCKSCKKEFDIQAKLSSHNNKVHKPSVCPICNKTVKILRMHISKLHREDSKKAVQCDM